MFLILFADFLNESLEAKVFKPYSATAMQLANETAASKTERWTENQQLLNTEKLQKKQ